MAGVVGNIRMQRRNNGSRMCRRITLLGIAHQTAGTECRFPYGRLGGGGSERKTGANFLKSKHCPLVDLIICTKEEKGRLRALAQRRNITFFREKSTKASSIS